MKRVVVILLVLLGLIVLFMLGILAFRYFFDVGDKNPIIDNKDKIISIEEFPLSLNFTNTCEDTPIIFTGNLWIDRVYDKISNLNRYSVKVEVDEIGNKKYNIIAFLDRVGEVHEGSTGYVSCSKYDVIPTLGIKTFTLDCGPDDIFQGVGDISRVFIETIPEDYKSSCAQRIELEKAISKELFKPLIICPDGWSITNIGENYIYALKGGSFKLEVGKEFRVWEGEEAGIDYNLSKVNSKFILDVHEWAVPPVCDKIFGNCDEDYLFEINPDLKTCVKMD